MCDIPGLLEISRFSDPFQVIEHVEFFQWSCLLPSQYSPCLSDLVRWEYGRGGSKGN
jgi:hypothetical protein